MRFTIAILTVSLPFIANAHHSRANYDMDTFREVDGTVVEFSWRNPHAFAVIEVIDDANQTSRLLLELNSKPVMAGMGWKADSVVIGDRIHVRGNPDRNAQRKQLFVRYVINRDGVKLWSFGRTRDEKARFEAENPVVRKPLVGSKDFSGVWNRARLRGAERRRPDPFSPADLPVTAAGAAAKRDFDPNNDPVFECLPATLPRTIVPVYLMEIKRVRENLLTFDYEFNNGYRDIHMGQHEFPSGLEPTRMGYSIGHLEDGDLVIHTKHFSYDRWGNGRGVPSGEQKEVFERYSLTNDGKRLEVTFTVVDPEYLQGPPEPQRGAYVLRNNVELSDWNCDPDAAVRHLTGK
jgi:hypothetical protein